jgi:predicted dehydrogenase
MRNKTEDRGSQLQVIKPGISRRSFARRALAATAAFSFQFPVSFGRPRAGEKLNLGIIGVGNRGMENLAKVGSENIVALCDVDDTFLAAAAKKFPGARTFKDFRRLLEQKDIDAVVISTPDHTHAVATVAALQSGRHVYCEKPLAHTVSECRRIREVARRGKCATQMGTQIHASPNYHRVVELVKKGVIGPVREVHAWVSYSHEMKPLPEQGAPVPKTLDYDLWLGPVPYLPYHPEYAPKNWRYWWAFGGGLVGDYGCHFIDLPNWALELGDPASIEVAEGPPPDEASTPPWLVLRYEFPARNHRGAVTLYWHHGGRRPANIPAEWEKKWGAVLFKGAKGSLLSDYETHLLLPEKDFADLKPPAPFIPDSPGHHQEWLDACKTGKPTTCNFEYSGRLAEAVLLGNVAYRTGKKIEWDSVHLKARNAPEATPFIQHHYRAGWKI